MLRVLAIAGFTLGAGTAFGQTATQRPEFEVASIRLHKSGDLRGMFDNRGGRFTALNVPLQPILARAFGIKNFQLVGAPSWMILDRYDIEAEAEGNPSREAMLQMVQALFEDRFQLKYHRETREMPVYALVVFKAGKLHEVAGDCEPAPKPKPGEPPPVRCGSAAFSFGRIAGRSVPLASFADTLSRVTDRLVLDRTDLNGKYDINLEFTRDHGRIPAPAGEAAPTGVESPQATDPTGPTLFTALQEQLGLKLESQKGPVEIVVIDHVERPSEN